MRRVNSVLPGSNLAGTPAIRTFMHVVREWAIFYDQPILLNLEPDPKLR